MKYSLGRYVFGLAAIASGICAIAWHDYTNWHQIKALGTAPYRETLTYVVAAVQILGGAAVLWPRTARAGAVALVAVYSVFALVAVPLIIKQPIGYNSYGNFLEQFSLVTGALILLACSGAVTPGRTSRLAAVGYYGFGVCVLSFGLEQFFYLSETASLVPKWIPPGQTFWAIATTAAFGLASVGLLTGLMARLASVLTTAMLLGFGLIVWVPIIVAAPHVIVGWSEGLETFAIAGSAWIVADYLRRRSYGEAKTDGATAALG